MPKEKIINQTATKLEVEAYNFKFCIKQIGKPQPEVKICKSHNWVKDKYLEYTVTFKIQQ